jgi:hypothetical protein
MYSGSKRNTNEISVLISKKQFNTDVMLWEVDGQRSTSTMKRYASMVDGSFRVELLPGKHSLLVGYHKKEGNYVSNSSKSILISFDSEPGHMYELKALVDEIPKKSNSGSLAITYINWSPILTDLNTGIVLYPTGK